MDPDVVVVIVLIVSGGGGGGSGSGGGIDGIGDGGGGGGNSVLKERAWPGTIVDVMPIAWMIVVVGDGDGGRGNGGGGGDSCLRRRAGWRRLFCGDRHAVKIGSPI